VSRVWVPTPLVASTPYQTLPDNRLTADGGTATLVTLDRRDGLAVVFASFPAGVKPVVAVTSRVATRDVAVDLTAPRRARREDRAVLDHFLRPTHLIPTDGIVKRAADEITRGRTTPLDQARAIYDWIVEHTQRNPKTRGCGLGNIRYMLESGDLSGKCADLNALFVGLARAAGLPARDVYGIRTLKSELGYRSLGVSSETITRAQHCRAEVYLDDHGWVPVDPADVRKVVLEEPPGDRRLDDDLVWRTRERLFGAWEMNWMAYNFAHDVRLPESHGDPVPFLMYPQAETEEGRVDSLDPERFRYDITAREVGPSTGMQP
jgi:transglutaminase-like putative cysteine protease